tara:strand:- start:572 stop:1048 length:477 start_codon:yes stop_codon:yes gene_type:complete
MRFFFQRWTCFRPVDADTNDHDVSNNTILVSPPGKPVTIPPNMEFGKKPGYIYLLREREFLKTNEEIYKIGKTINIKNRMPSYPKDSRLYLCFYCPSDIDAVEKHLISVLERICLRKRTDIGSEYFEGDVRELMANLLDYAHTQHYSSLSSTVLNFKL